MSKRIISLLINEKKEILNPCGLQEYLYNNVSPCPASGCWIWMGSLNDRGYGLIAIGDKRAGSKKRFKAHRASYGAFYGNFSDDLWVLHTCDIPACISPYHLYLGTVVENVQDMMARGRKFVTPPPRTICKRGHPLVDGNIYYDKHQKRSCMICRRLNMLKHIALRSQKRGERCLSA